MPLYLVINTSAHVLIRKLVGPNSTTRQRRCAQLRDEMGFGFFVLALQGIRTRRCFRVDWQFGEVGPSGQSEKFQVSGPRLFLGSTAAALHRTGAWGFAFCQQAIQRYSEGGGAL